MGVSGFFSHYVNPRDGTVGGRLWVKCLYLLNHVAGSIYFLKKILFNSLIIEKMTK